MHHMLPVASQPNLLDALIVGGGFGGVFQLKSLRDEGYKVRLVDSASDFGGVWHWNRYPGARVDSAVPHYQFSSPELWTDWNWKQRFPSGEELRDYFAHVDRKWDLRKDTDFRTEITSAVWNEVHSHWVVKSNNGKAYLARFLLLCTGFAAKRSMPDYVGLGRFKGTWLHPSCWPKEDIELAGKRVCIIGTGATGIQLTQTVSKVAGQLVVFQRTPNFATPMGQVDYTDGQQEFSKNKYPDFFEVRKTTFAGFNFNPLPRVMADDSPEQCRKALEELWAKGDFQFFVGNYQDVIVNPETNKVVYEFWRDKTRQRIADPRLQALLAPTVAPHPFGCKRVPLENGYFEVFSQPNVHLVDVNETPVLEVTERGIRTTEKEWKFDIVICATGYDAVTGGLKQIDIRGRGNQSMAELWSGGVRTYLGMAVAGFPNMFFSGGPHSPVGFCNGPTCAESQGSWISALVREMRERGLRTVEAEKHAEDRWLEAVRAASDSTLMDKAKSWYNGSAIEGKKKEPLVWVGGVPRYLEALENSRLDGWAGFRME